MRVLLWCAALVLAALPVQAADFPSTVTVKVGSEVGTSNDRAARLLASYLGQYLPGSPQIAVENVPGAGGARLAHQMVMSEPKDGSVMGMVSTDLVRSHLMDPSGFDFDPSSMEWVGGLIAPVQLCVTSKQSPIGIADLGKEDIKFGATSQNAAFYSYAAVLRYLNHGKFKIVLGFKSELDLMAALDRGEINAYCSETYSTFQREGRSATQVIMAGVGSAARLKELGVANLADGLTGADAAAVDLLAISSKGYYTFALPSDTPSDILEIYRAAFDKAMADPNLQADMQKQFQEFTPSTGPQLDAIVAGAVKTDPAAIQKANEILQ
jgi:tripartite-type tricarboxylate transporter receptor subunit TctC